MVKKMNEQLNELLKMIEDNMYLQKKTKGEMNLLREQVSEKEDMLLSIEKRLQQQYLKMKRLLKSEG
jgi:hypothetical protein